VAVNHSRIDRAVGDRRPESHKRFVDTVEFNGEPLSTSRGWQARRDPLSKVKVYDDFFALETDRIENGTTLGIVRPTRILGLEISAASRPDWTKAEKSKLLQSQQQAGLFDATDARALTTLRNLLHDFHYLYECSVTGVAKQYRHKIVDWEGALSIRTAFEAMAPVGRCLFDRNSKFSCPPPIRCFCLALSIDFQINGSL
jgi:hypothetical protein